MTASSNGNGAAIGGGGIAGDRGTITINGGSVTAQGGGRGAAIGGGGAGYGGTIDIAGGTVIANSTGSGTPGIGGGYAGVLGTLSIGQGADVTARGYRPVGSGEISGSEASTFSVAGTLRITSPNSLWINPGNTLTVTSTGIITGVTGEADTGVIRGLGTIENAGSITLPTSRVGLPLPVIKDHQYTVSFDGQGGSDENDVKVFAKSFNDGARTLPTPTRAGYGFGGWYTESNGGGTKIEAATTLPGTSDGTPVAITLYAKWSLSAPTLTGDPTATGQVDAAFTYTPTLVGSGTTVTLTAGNLPSGLNLDDATGAITGTPSAGSAGTYPITLTADNDVEPNATLDVAITINQAPSITGASTATAVVGQAFEYTPTTLSGSPAPTVTLIDSDMPEGLSLNASTGKISGTPVGSGTFPMILKASNGIGTPATLEFTITINRAPTLTGASTATGQTGQPFSYLPTSFYGTPSPTATVSAGDLPAGLSLNASTGKISGIPTASGTFPITLMASNGVGTAPTLDVTITIATSLITGLAPKITGTVREGQTLTAHPGPVVPGGATFAYQWKANGKNISGATQPTLKLGKAQAGRRITVTLTATAPGYIPSTATSASTGLVSSPYARIILTTKTVKKGQTFGLIATGLKPHQKYKVWLGGKKTYTAKADAHGTVSRTAKFKSSVKPGTRRVRVSGYNSKGKRTFTILTRVTYRK